MKKQFLFATALVTTFVMGACSLEDFEECTEVGTYANEVSGEIGTDGTYRYFQPASRTVERYGLELY